MGVEVIIEDGRWSDAGLEALAPRAAAAAFAHLGLEGLEFACLGTDDARIAGLNAEFRGKPAARRTCSRPVVGPRRPRGPKHPWRRPPPARRPEYGDIALPSTPCAAESGGGGELHFPDHISHLVVHTVSLHLFSATIINPMPMPDLMEATRLPYFSVTSGLLTPTS